MRLIHSVKIKGNIQDTANMLAANGIMVSTTDELASHERHYTTAAKMIKQGIWVHINHQYHDAIELLNNPDHEVQCPLTQDEMNELKKQAKKNIPTIYLYILKWTIIYFLAPLGAIILLLSLLNGSFTIEL